MARLGDDGRSLTVTVVVFGAARSGKTAVLRGIHARLGSGRGDVGGAASVHHVPLDWLPLELGVIGGRDATVMIYAVPGLAPYDATRRLLLADADGVIFVADAQAARLEENIEALRVLGEQLGDRDVPIVYFHSKTDLPDELLLPGSVLDEALHVGAAPSFAGDGVRGVNVREALQAVLTLVLRRLQVPPTPEAAGE